MEGIEDDTTDTEYPGKTGWVGSFSINLGFIYCGTTHTVWSWPSSIFERFWLA